MVAFRALFSYIFRESTHVICCFHAQKWTENHDNCENATHR